MWKNHFICRLSISILTSCPMKRRDIYSIHVKLNLLHLLRKKPNCRCRDCTRDHLQTVCIYFSFINKLGYMCAHRLTSIHRFLCLSNIQVQLFSRNLSLHIVKWKKDYLKSTTWVYLVAQIPLKLVIQTMFDDLFSFLI